MNDLGLKVASEKSCGSRSITSEGKRRSVQLLTLFRSEKDTYHYMFGSEGVEKQPLRLPENDKMEHLHPITVLSSVSA